ncbi:MAG: MFS transporter [Candidatus Lokiarchaeota archaeon]|nr:MFS transporter [Candidatus Lokiarchaeota archaeon]
MTQATTRDGPGTRIFAEPSRRETMMYGFGELTDQMSHQAFQFLVFTFYYAVVGINVNLLAMGFIVFAIWDSINDPILGPISDRTSTRIGRRRFWIVVSIVPFALVNLFLFTAPISADEATKFVYMLVIIMIYDLFYTIFATNHLSLFPEMFKTEQMRSRANAIKNTMVIVGVLIGFVLPTVLISSLTPENGTPAEINRVAGMYMNTGILLCVLIVVFGFLFAGLGMKEDPARLTKPQEMPPLLSSIKQTLKNKTFVIFVTANLFKWYVFKMLTTIIPLYGIHVLGITKGSFLLSLLLLVAFLTAAALFPLMRKLGLKVGMRNGMVITTAIWIFALVPFAFLDNQPFIAMGCMAFMGIGLSGSMYYVDIIIASIIDEDEVLHGKRREGSYYGVNALINRYSTILVFVVIAFTLTGYGWDNYLVGAGLSTTNLQIGLKLLLVPFSIAGLVVVLVLLKKFPLHGQKWKDVQEKLKIIRDKKE